MSGEVTVSLVTPACPGTKFRARLVNVAGVVGTLSLLKRNRSSGVGWIALGPDLVHGSPRTEIKPSRWPISCVATVSKSIVPAATPSEQIVVEREVGAEGYIAVARPETTHRRRQVQAREAERLEVGFGGSNVAVKLKPAGTVPRNCAAVGSEVAMLSLAEAEELASATTASRMVSCNRPGAVRLT